MSIVNSSGFINNTLFTNARETLHLATRFRMTREGNPSLRVGPSALRQDDKLSGVATVRKEARIGLVATGFQPVSWFGSLRSSFRHRLKACRYKKERFGASCAFTNSAKRACFLATGSPKPREVSGTLVRRLASLQHLDGLEALLFEAIQRRGTMRSATLRVALVQQAHRHDATAEVSAVDRASKDHRV